MLPIVLYALTSNDRDPCGGLPVSGELFKWVATGLKAERHRPG